MGEGCSAQLFQACGGCPAAFLRRLLSVRAVWVSHHHADHVCGFPMLLEHIQRARTAHAICTGGGGGPFERVAVVCPPDARRYFEYAACVAGLDDLVAFVPTAASLFSGHTLALPLPAAALSQQPQRAHHVHMLSVPVPHCRDSYALVLTLAPPAGPATKVVYSGDCRPSDALVAAGRGCALLLHEATFDDALAGDAACKRHCTTSEAVEVGRRMRARHVILTHFSQRYPAIVQSSSRTSFPVPVPVPALAPSQATYGPLTMTWRPPLPPGPPPAPAPHAVAFDFLTVALPSQIDTLADATDRIVQTLAAAAEVGR